MHSVRSMALLCLPDESHVALAFFGSSISSYSAVSRLVNLEDDSSNSTLNTFDKVYFNVICTAYPTLSILKIEDLIRSI